ncbi:MAG: hypothetical protein ACI9YL_001066 [Luteibaculaceae bacterium]|jgi:hypothetical protein
MFYCIFHLRCLGTLLFYLCAMKLQLDFPKIDAPKLKETDIIFGLGSCFGNEVSQQLLQAFIPGMCNPFGTIFHPIPMAQQLNRIMENSPFTPQDFETEQGSFFSYFSHTLLRGTSLEAVQKNHNQQLANANTILLKSTKLILTFGTNWGFQLGETGEWVSNCQKQPAALFNREFAGGEENSQHWIKTLQTLFAVNPGIEVIVTVSPVRHIKDGLSENNKSKAALITLVHQLVATFPNQVFYMPSYEVILDVLRDYRFFADDLCHINSLGLQCIMDWLQKEWFSPNMLSYWKAAKKVQNLFDHRVVSSNFLEIEQLERKKNQLVAEFNSRYHRFI